MEGGINQRVTSALVAGKGELFQRDLTDVWLVTDNQQTKQKETTNDGE